jgi:hypothetical protein
MHQGDMDTCSQGNPGRINIKAKPDYFLKDYVPPRNPSTKQFKLPKKLKYEIFEPKIPVGVIIEENMLGVVGNLKFVDHKLAYIKKFLELALDKYMHTKIIPYSQEFIVEP